MSSSHSTSAYQKQIEELLIDLCYEHDPVKMEIIKERIETIRKLCPDCTNENQRRQHI
jgi:hypothetical protein